MLVSSVILRSEVSSRLPSNSSTCRQSVPSAMRCRYSVTPHTRVACRALVGNWLVTVSETVAPLSEREVTASVGSCRPTLIHHWWSWCSASLVVVNVSPRCLEPMLGWTCSVVHGFYRQRSAEVRCRTCAASYSCTLSLSLSLSDILFVSGDSLRLLLVVAALYIASHEGTAHERPQPSKIHFSSTKLIVYNTTMF